MPAPELPVVYLLVTLYALCYQLQAPLEPFLVERLVKGTDAAASYAQLQSFFSLVQMIGSFVVGYMLDVAGLRGMFALNFVACAACYGMLANANSIEMLFLSKVPGMFQAGFLCAQTAAAKLTPDGPERSTALGRLTSAYTVGGVVGPALGGYIGTQMAARFAVAGSMVAVGLVMLLPTAVEQPTKPIAGSATPPPAASGSWWRRMREITPLVWPLMLTKMASGFVKYAVIARTPRPSDPRPPSTTLHTRFPARRPRRSSAAGAARPLLLKNTFRFDQARLGAFMSGTADAALRTPRPEQMAA